MNSQAQVQKQKITTPVEFTDSPSQESLIVVWSFLGYVISIGTHVQDNQVEDPAHFGTTNVGIVVLMIKLKAEVQKGKLNFKYLICQQHRNLFIH